MLMGLLLALAATAAAPPPETYYGEDGCRYVKRAPAPVLVSKVPRRSITSLMATPAAAPAASAPIAKKAKHRAQSKRPAAPSPAYDKVDCDEGGDMTPIERMTAERFVPDVPFVAAGEPGDYWSAPETPVTVFESASPPNENIVGGPNSLVPLGAPALVVIAPPGLILVSVTPAVPEPSTYALFTAGLAALVSAARRGRKVKRREQFPSL